MYKCLSDHHAKHACHIATAFRATYGKPSLGPRHIPPCPCRAQLRTLPRRCDAARPMNATTSPPTSSPSGPMTRARAKLLQAKVNSLLSLCDFDTPLDGLLLHMHTLCIIRYEEKDLVNGGTAAKEAKNSLSPAV